MSDTIFPVFFFGHGSPLNAIEDNEFSRNWERAADGLPRPRAILCISAHWLTKGSAVTAMDSPRTIHDFGGFPRELYGIRYPAPGSPAVAAEVAEALAPTEVALDREWGLDHGAWSVLRRVYPSADIPIVQLGMDMGKPGTHHYGLGKRLRGLRSQGILIVGSGNIVHNLGMVAWDRMDRDDYAFDWARKIDGAFTELVASGKDADLIAYERLGRDALLAVPTPDHYYPLLYCLGARDPSEPVSVFNRKAVAGSLTMTSFRFG
jgi:4,5-DOPA dioxygenase extradiol